MYELTSTCPLDLETCLNWLDLRLDTWVGIAASKLKIIKILKKIRCNERLHSGLPFKDWDLIWELLGEDLRCDLDLSQLTWACLPKKTWQTFWKLMASTWSWPLVLESWLVTFIAEDLNWTCTCPQWLGLPLKRPTNKWSLTRTCDLTWNSSWLYGCRSWLLETWVETCFDNSWNYLDLSQMTWALPRRVKNELGLPK